MKSYLFAIVVALQFVIAAPCMAQQKLNSEIKLGLSNVLRFNGVAKDLELTDEQSDQLTGLWIEVKTKLEQAFKDYQANYSPRFSDPEKKELQKKLAEAIHKVREEETDKLNEVLLPAQVKRLKQIQFQILKRDTEGFEGLADALKLTDEQIKQIGKLKTDVKKTLQELRQYARQEQLTPNELAEEVKAIRSQTGKDLLNVLTAIQRRKLEDLEGEKFEVQTGTPKKANR